MDQATGERIMLLQKQALEDEQYQLLLDEYEAAGARLVEIFPTLTKAQQDAVTEHFGVFGAMHLRMLELALHD